MSPERDKQDKVYHVLKRDCNATDYWQRWIWTRNDQLMHVDTLKCLQCPVHTRLDTIAIWRLFVAECTSIETRQLWQCQGQNNSNFWSNTSKLYLYQAFSYKEIYGINMYFELFSQGMKWRRFPSNESLCFKGKF